MPTTLLTNLSPVSTTLGINLCQGFSVIGSVVDTGNKFITGVGDTTEQLSHVITVPGDKFIAIINDTGEQ